MIAVPPCGIVLASHEKREIDVSSDDDDRRPYRAELAYRSLFEHHPDFVYELDLEGRFVAANSSLEAAAGLSCDALCSISFHDLIHPDDLPKVQREFELAAGGSPRCYQCRGIGKDGRLFHVAVTNVPIVIEGEVVGVYGIARDVTAKVEAERALAASEERFRLAMKHAPIGKAIVGLDGRMLQVNDALCRFVGRPEEELLSLTTYDITHPEDVSCARARYQELLDGRVDSVTMEKRYLHADGSVVWGMLSVSLARDDAGNARYVIGQVVDLTERKAAEAAVHQGRSLLRIAGSMARVGGWALELPEEQSRWSDELYEIFEYETERPPALRAWAELFVEGEDDRGRVLAAVDACRRSGTPFDVETRAITGKGRELWVRVAGEAERGSGGQIVRLRGAVQDITEQKEAAEESERLAEQLVTTLESISDALFTLDHDWRFSYVNGRAEQILRADRQSLVGRKIWDELDPVAAEHFRVGFERAIVQASNVVVEAYYAPLGLWIEANAFPSSQGLAVYFRDVTERHRVEAALRVSEERFRMLAEQSAEAIFMHLIRPEGRLDYLNPAAARIAGYTREELYANPKVLAEAVSEDDKQRLTSVLLDPATSASSPPVEIDYRRPDGQALRLRVRGTPIRDVHGNVTGMHAVATDVTRQYQEQQALERALRQQLELNELKTSFVQAVSHELRTPLTSVRGFVDLLLRHELPREQQVRYLKRIQAGTARLQRIVTNVLDLGRLEQTGTALHLRPLDLADVVRRVVSELEVEDRNLHLELEPVQVSADADLLERVVDNLIRNAARHTPQGTNIWVRTDRPGTIVVEDDGPGIPEDARSEVFEPFRRGPLGWGHHTHGTGIGLSIVERVVRLHGGEVTLDTRPGGGARFTIRLAPHGD